MPHESTPPNSTSQPGPPGKALRLGMLSGLVGLTSLAVGATTSPWLVPPYLAAMAWLLIGPAPRRSPEAGAAPGRESIPAPVGQPEPIAAGDAPSADPAALGEGGKPKAKSGRGRGRKPKAKTKPEVPAGTTAATWVQVAPGKFIRVERPVESVDDPTTEPEPETAAPTEWHETGIVADPAADAETPVLVEVEPEPFEPRESWLETTLITEDESPADPVYVDPPEPARLVVVDHSSRPSQPRVWPARAARVRPVPRPKLRRGNGRVGAVPRVVLHRG